VAVPPGTHFGPYEILALVGAGGMGEVYRARDPRLARDVAIKVLPHTYSADPDRLRRFEQEARAASALNHPNILTIYDIGEHEGRPYVVSELLEGETLRERMGGSALPQRKVVEYALQIASGLAAAHDKGIVHRDVKPENVFITKDSRIKILDFGLAKLMAPLEGEAEEAKTLRVDTDAGIIIGTAGYMSPEQVRGSVPDHRSDIFAFGAVLYEMLAGKRAFKGESKLDTMSAILKEDPSDIIDANPRIGPGLERIVRHCLEKNPSERFNSARDLAFAIEALSGSGSGEPSQRLDRVRRASRQIKKREMIAWSVVAIAGVVVAVLLLILYSRLYETPTPEAARFLVYPPEKTIFQGAGDYVSPDGHRLLFTAIGVDGKRALWVRTIDSLTAQLLPGTEDASQPFWSPDSRFIGFFAGGKLKKIEASGGSVQVLADAQAARGGTWNSDGVIVFSPAVADGLLRVGAAGGPATQITTLDTAKFQTSHCWPFFLPDGKHFIYLARNSQRQNSAIYAGSIDSNESKLIVNSDAGAIYAAPGYLFFLRERSLMAQPFDADKMRLTGEPVPVVEQIGYSATTARAFFSVSNNGVLAYRGNVPLNGQLTWYDRSGKSLERVGTVGDFLGFSLSPDQKRIAVSRLDVETGSYDVWMIELGRGTTSRFTFDQTNETFPIWSPDGNRIAFSSNKYGPTDLFQKASNGAGSAELLFKSTNLKAPNDWSPNGQTIVYNEFDPKTNSDLWVLPLGGDPNPAPVMQTTFSETNGRFSPDGKWIAYESNESGPGQIYVQGFPTGGKTQISTLGGFQPRWRGDGKELFYIGPDKKLMVVEIQAGTGGIQAGSPRPLFDLRIGNLPGSPYYDVTRDGQRFLVSIIGEETAPTPMTVVMNWTAELKK
jgi:eukaryotic-like serine/threonine-protein kinase